MDLSYLTSLRIGDILTIAVSDYDKEFLRVKEGKGQVKARIEMSSELVRTIVRARALKRPVGYFYIITNRSGQKYTYDGFASAWQRMMARVVDCGSIEKHFTFHDIRAKSLTDKDEQQLNAQLAAGHTDPRMTARYIRNKKGRRFQPVPGELLIMRLLVSETCRGNEFAK